MAWTQADLDALDAVIKSGSDTVSYGNGQTVKYRSLAEMIQIRTMISDALNAAIPQSMSTVAQFQSGM